MILFVEIEDSEVQRLAERGFVREHAPGQYTWTEQGLRIFELFLRFQTGIFNPSLFTQLSDLTNPPNQPEEPK